MKLKPEEYTACGGSKCPNCGSYNITSVDGVELDGEAGWQSIECLHCGAEWTDVWKLDGYIDLKVKS